MFTITSRLAYLIKISSGENIPQPILPVDPRIIIPISAVETINSVKLPTKTDSEVDELLAQSNITPELEKNFKEKIDKLLGYQQLDNNWKIKLSSISPHLQLDLLYRLINSRSSSNSDWRNLKRDVQYNFAQGWHYKTILGISFILSLIVVTVSCTLLIPLDDYSDDSAIIDWIGLASPSLCLVILCFWVALWQGIEERWEAQLFILFSLFGVFTFFQQLKRLWINDSVWPGINSLYNAVILEEHINHRALNFAVSGFFAIAGGWAGVLTGHLLEAAVSAFLLRLFLAGARVGTRLSLRGWFWGMVVIVVMAMLALPGAIAGVGLGAWYRANDKINWTRYLAIFAFPFFCTFPMVLGYCSYAFYDWFSLNWQQITIIWIAILGVCTVLWQWGQKLDYEARNPLKGILDSVKDEGDIF